ncbi:MAG: hypothetical protein LHW51_12030 [Candidatus Cloacimonetes bacterium]|nr:hypothetical protein [Candidatus Cloacimonadota bacterium]
MKSINEPGDYRVRIKGAYWVKLNDKNGDTNRLQACLPGVCEINGEEAEITGYLPFTSAYIQSGKNAGKKLVDLNNELLIQLGMKPVAGGYIDPAKLTEELEGREARFVVDYENDQNGKPHLRVKFINSAGRSTGRERGEVYFCQSNWKQGRSSETASIHASSCRR